MDYPVFNIFLGFLLLFSFLPELGKKLSLFDTILTIILLILGFLYAFYCVKNIEKKHNNETQLLNEEIDRLKKENTQNYI